MPILHRVPVGKASFGDPADQLPKRRNELPKKAHCWKCGKTIEEAKDLLFYKLRPYCKECYDKQMAELRPIKIMETKKKHGL